jgi:molybdopterin-guanine dinucleotide biosynthesis protein A
MTGNISGVILAGGAGKRFNGTIKAKLIIDGKSIISRIFEVFEQVFSEIIIVTNTPDEFAEYRRCIFIRDLITDRGPLGGIHAAMSVASNEAIFVVAADMPFLSTALIRKQADYFNEINCDILIPKIGELIEPLHGIYRKSIAGVLENYLKEGNSFAVRDFLHRTNVMYLQIEESEKNLLPFLNINSPDDLLRAGNPAGLSG